LKQNIEHSNTIPSDSPSRASSTKTRIETIQ